MRQLLVTLLVLAVAIAVIRLRGPRATVEQPARRDGRERRRPSGAALAGYALVAVLVISASAVFYLRWKENNQVVTVRVLDARSGDAETYQVLKKNIQGRSFRTVDGRYVSLGDGDRMELIER